VDWFADPQIWAALLTLTALEIVLGVDNLIFIAVMTERLPSHRRTIARRIGLTLALVTRLGLLAGVTWITRLTTPILTPFDHPLAWRDLILIAGGLFLIFSSTREIHGEIEGDRRHHGSVRAGAPFAAVVGQIMLLDIVFSLDSLITAVGMAREFWIMATAVVIATAVMLAASAAVAGFINRHPTIKVLAFSFLLLIGMTLVADGAGFPIPRGYIYAAIGFSIGVEAINQLAARRRAGKDRHRSADTPAMHSARRNPWKESNLLRTPRRSRSTQ
jgi:predicted tellurium resistance membrane protein TerC